MNNITYKLRNKFLILHLSGENYILLVQHDDAEWLFFYFFLYIIHTGLFIYLLFSVEYILYTKHTLKNTFTFLAINKNIYTHNNNTTTNVWRFKLLFKKKTVKHALFKFKKKNYIFYNFKSHDLINWLSCYFYIVSIRISNCVRFL